MIHSQQLLLLSQPLLQPQPLLPPRIPFPFPQQQNNRIIQIQLQLFPKPTPLPQPLEHPQLVAVKSLILSASRFYYGLSYVEEHVNVSRFLQKKT